MWQERRQRQRCDVEAKVADLKAKLPSLHRPEAPRHEDKAGTGVGASACPDRHRRPACARGAGDHGEAGDSCHGGQVKVSAGSSLNAGAQGERPV